MFQVLRTHNLYVAAKIIELKNMKYFIQKYLLRTRTDYVLNILDFTDLPIINSCEMYYRTRNMYSLLYNS